MTGMTTRWRSVGIAALACGVLLLLPGAAAAQSGGIAGVVKDTTGAVLPGVTVEAASPALIEKVRTVVTDSTGQYKIVDLGPGVYSVTFSLTGFVTARREGIELTTAFTASVNAELGVGNVQETILVSGQTPVVDVQNVVQQRVMTREIIDNLPTGKMFINLATLIPGMQVAVGGGGGTTSDVGGSAGERYSPFSIHGGRGDAEYFVEGLSIENFTAGGGRGTASVHINNGSIQEITFETDNQSAERENGGPAPNMIPKDGGNRFTGSFFASGTSHRFQQSNLTQALRDRGLTNVSAIDKIWDFNPSFGGPVSKDRLWFYASARHWGTDNLVAGLYYNAVDYTKTPQSFAYVPDLSRQALDDLGQTAGNLRLTWQATPKNKISGYFHEEDRCSCHDAIVQGALVKSPEAAPKETFKYPAFFYTVTWSAPLTNRLLLEGGFLRTFGIRVLSPAEPTTAPDLIGVLETSTNMWYRATQPTTAYVTQTTANNDTFRFAVSYVTGSHAFKVGVQDLYAHPDTDQPAVDNSLGYTFLNGRPTSLTMRANPLTTSRVVNAEGGLYAQDQWTHKRLTLNMGLRFDWVVGSVSAVHVGPGPFTPARDFPAVSDVPNWKDLSPRFGAVYDLFGNGKTAIKVGVNRYVDGISSGFTAAAALDPQVTQVSVATRSWTDTNGNFIPDCVLTNPAAQVGADVCGATNPSTFGTQVVTTHFDPALLTGFNKHPYNWMISTSVQQELRPGVSANVAYFHHSVGNIGIISFDPTQATSNRLLQNRAYSPADYDPFCVTAPVDARLPNGGGYQVCGLRNLNPSKVFGLTDNYVTFNPQVTDVYNGVDLSVNARLPRGILLQGGTSTGHEVYDRCFVLNSQQDLLNCRWAPPFQTQVKLLGSVPLPWGFVTSATYQGLPGPVITAAYSASNASVVGSLGHNLAGNASTVSVPLITPGTMWEARSNQFDFRLSKRLSVGHARARVNLDIYNLMNASPVLAENVTYGSSWLKPTSVMLGRLFKFGAQIDF